VNFDFAGRLCDTAGKIGETWMGEVVSAKGPARPFYRMLYVQVMAAILLGGLIGFLWPAAGVALQPAGFVTLAATLSVVPSVPVAGMALIFGIDKFMSECRALTNIIGNGVATVVVSAWERELDRARMTAVLHGRAGTGTPALIRAAGGE
jgi:Na+/H+-dicarboxylate symporter